MNDLTTRIAKLLWAKLPAPQRASDEIDEAARAVVALVLDDAADVADSIALPMDGKINKAMAAYMRGVISDKIRAMKGGAA